MHPSMTQVSLDALAWIEVRGPDARRFLHGQVTQDVLGQPPNRVALGGLLSVQGRVIAILRLVPLAEDAVLLGLPKEIAAAVVLRLARYVLRAKLTLSDASAAWCATGLAGRGAAAALDALGLLPEHAGAGAMARRAAALAWRHDVEPERFIVLTRRESVELPALPPADGGPASDAQREWQAADVAAGLPQVHAATSEQFVAQMLNLDVLQGISFEKGCYTGQEVVARAHYRGRVKRRLQRFRTLAAPALALQPGDACALSDGRTCRVVEVAALADGRIEFLAVAPLSAGAASDEDAANASAATWAIESLPLPYALPD